jgi:alkane 1-monooxygenase
MHQKTRFERFLSDLLMGMALYGHFRTEHVLVHHRHVGTRNDAVTARYGENFYRFFIRVIPECFLSSWNTEKELLEKKNLPLWDFQNPFFIYFGLMFFFLLLAILIGGILGAICFIVQAFIAVLHLEVVNYIEHYGLVRQKLDNGKFEPTRPHHSWNANEHASNLLLINLQKHSDHHARPNKKYQHLQSYDADDAPQLPFGYPLMVLLSLIPQFWMKVMNPKVLEWRKRFYPDLQEWSEIP